MKLGYSNLLGEIINAEAIDYKDCKNFQIVCPCCSEPVFKVERVLVKKEIHYLSHYDKDKIYNDECDLRVNSISNSEIIKINDKARNQKLKLFMKVLQDSILNKYYISKSDYSATEKGIAKISKNIHIAKLRQFYFDKVMQHKILFNQNDFYECADSYVNEMIEIVGEFEETDFSIQVQKRIAHDMWKTIFTLKGKHCFSFLHSHAYIHLLTRFEAAIKERDLYPWEDYLMERMMSIVESDEYSGRFLLEELSNYLIYPPFVIEESSLTWKMLMEISHEIVGTLVSLPYFKMLKQNSLKEYQISSNVIVRR